MGFLNLFKSKQKEQEEFAEEQKRNELLKRFENEDLTKRAAKIEDINMKPNEYCYYNGNSYYKWQEERSRTIRTNYKGLSTNFRIAKGINYRVGSIRHESQKVTEWKDIFNGVPFITNKRIIFVNQNGIKTINLSSIVGMKAFSDGTHLFRESGKLIILLTDDAIEFNVILNRIMNNDLEGH